MPELSETARVNREVFLKSLVPRSRGTFWASGRIAVAMEDVDARAGDVLFEAGTPADQYYFVVTGEIEMVRPGARSWPVTGPGLVGVIDAALARPHARKAVAKTDARLLRLPVQVWFDVLEDSFELALAVLVNMAGVAHAMKLRPGPAGGFEAPSPPTSPPRALRTIVDRILFLRDTGLFRHAGTQALTSLAEVAEVVTLDAGAVLFDDKTRPGRIYVVVSGEVLASHAALPAPARFGVGGVVTGPAALIEQGAAFRAHAATPTTLLALGFDDVFDLMEEHFSLVRSVMIFVAGEVDMLLERDATAAPFVRTPP